MMGQSLRIGVVVLLSFTYISVSSTLALASESNLDLREALEECTEIAPGEKGYTYGWLLDKNLAKDLSEAEQAVLTEYITPSGRLIALGELILYTRIFLSKNGKYPSNSAEILSSAGIVPSYSDSELAVMNSSELLDYYRFTINPITGGLYDSFDNEVWVPFGILIKPITGEAGIKMIPGAVEGSDPIHPEMEMQPMRTWIIRVYGETPGRVLLEGNIWSDAREENDGWWK
jgi:hypothetical protein